MKMKPEDFEVVVMIAGILEDFEVVSSVNGIPEEVEVVVSSVSKIDFILFIIIFSLSITFNLQHNTTEMASSVSF